MRKSAAENTSIGIIILAAGGSRRMSEPKQFLRFDGKTLLRRAAETAVQTIYEPVVVVLGANFERAAAEIEDLPVKLVFNEKWRRGLSFSIKAGLEKLLKIAPETTAVVIALADQPFINANHLNLFAERFEQTQNPVVAAKYNQTHGVPALFAREVFEDLGALSGDKGAKSVIEKHRLTLSTIDLPEAAFDIDTPEDFQRSELRL